MPAPTSATNHEQPASSSVTEREQPKSVSIPEIMRASTPLFLAAIGGAVAIAAVFNPNISDTKMTAALGLAGTAIAGAAGLAQSGNNESDFSATQEGNKIKINASTSEPGS